MYSVNELEDKLIDLAFAEDIGDGDHTTLCCIPEDAPVTIAIFILLPFLNPVCQILKCTYFLFFLE